MKFPQSLRTFNHAAAVLAGVIILIIGFLTTIEGIARGLFNSPTSWSLDVCRYLLVWTIFLGSAFAFQEKGHVAVDFMRKGLGRKFGCSCQRCLSSIGYLIALLYVMVLMYSSVDLMVYAFQNDKLTRGTIQIPIVWLYLAMGIGSIGMVITLCFIQLDLKSGSDEYI